MSDIRPDHRYTDDHEWVRVDTEDSSVVVIGITDYAQSNLGDVVMVELPEVGDEVAAAEAFGTVESPKSVSDLFSPVSGEVVAINEALEDAPEQVNSDCYGTGWIIKLKVADGDAAAAIADLMDPEAYQAHVTAAEEH
jgi:glycine cleavage system H protein